MDLKTESGVSIKIIADGSSKILFFNTPVRTVELKKDEISQIGVLLLSDLEVKDVLLSRKPESRKAIKKTSQRG